MQNKLVQEFQKDQIETKEKTIQQAPALISIDEDSEAKQTTEQHVKVNLFN